MSYAFLSFTGASTHSYPTDIRPLHEYVSARFLYLPLRSHGTGRALDREPRRLADVLDRAAIACEIALTNREPRLRPCSYRLRDSVNEPCRFA